MRTILVLLALAGGGPAEITLDAPRAAHTASLLADGRVLLVGGCTGSSCDRGPVSWTTQIFDPATNRLLPGPRLPRARIGHLAVSLPDGTVLLAGGWDEHGLTSAAELYVDGRFEPLPSMREGRGGATATLLRDGRVLIAGGSRNGRSVSSSELYDPRARRFVEGPRMGAARHAHAAALLPDGRVLVAGGSTGSRVHRSAEVFEPRANRFRPVGAMRVPRHKLAAAPVAGGALVLGGSDASDFAGRYASVERFDARRNRFVAHAPLAQRRFKHPDAVAVTPDGRVWLAGGAPVVELLDPKARRFRQVFALPGERYFSTATALSDGRVLVAGGYDAGIAVSDRAWIIDAP